MNEADFQDYWLNKHAVQFASNISQIKKYKIDCRIPFSLDRKPIWNAAAEIWLRNEAEQIASLQSPEFIDGARRDEPNWAAFWNTLGLDCDTTTVAGGDVPDGAVKLLVLYRRGDGLTRDAYRARHRADLAEQAAAVQGVLRHDLAFTRDALYQVGEPRFDAVGHFWFESPEAVEAMAASPARELILPVSGETVNPAQVFPMLTREHWVIGPEPRA